MRFFIANDLLASHNINLQELFIDYLSASMEQYHKGCIAQITADLAGLGTRKIVNAIFQIQIRIQLLRK